MNSLLSLLVDGLLSKEYNPQHSRLRLGIEEMMCKYRFDPFTVRQYDPPSGVLPIYRC